MVNRWGRFVFFFFLRVFLLFMLVGIIEIIDNKIKVFLDYIISNCSMFMKMYYLFFMNLLFIVKL